MYRKKTPPPITFKSSFVLGVDRERYKRASSHEENPLVLVPYESNEFTHTSMVFEFDPDSGKVQRFINIACDNFNNEDDRFFCGGDMKPEEYQTWSDRLVISPLEEPSQYMKKNILGFHYLAEVASIQPEFREELEKDRYEHSSLLNNVLPLELLISDSHFFHNDISPEGVTSFKKYCNDIIEEYDKLEMSKIVNDNEARIAIALQNESFLKHIDDCENRLYTQFCVFRDSELEELIENTQKPELITRYELELEKVRPTAHLAKLCDKYINIMHPELIVDKSDAEIAKMNEDYYSIASSTSECTKMFNEFYNESLNEIKRGNNLVDGKLTLTSEERTDMIESSIKLVYLRDLIEANEKINNPGVKALITSTDIGIIGDRFTKINEGVVERGTELFGDNFAESSKSYDWTKNMQNKLQEDQRRFEFRYSEAVDSYIEAALLKEPTEIDLKRIETATYDLKVNIDKINLINEHLDNQKYTTVDKDYLNAGNSLLGKNEHGEPNFEHMSPYYNECYRYFMELNKQSDEYKRVIEKGKDELYKADEGKSDLTKEALEKIASEVNESTTALRITEAQERFLKEYVRHQELNERDAQLEAIKEGDISQIFKMDKDTRDARLTYEENHQKTDIINGALGVDTTLTFDANRIINEQGFSQKRYNLNILQDEIESISIEKINDKETTIDIYNKINSGQALSVYSDYMLSENMKHVHNIADISQSHEGPSIEVDSSESISNTIDNLRKAHSYETDGPSRDRLEQKIEIVDSFKEFSETINAKNFNDLNNLATEAAGLSQETKVLLNQHPELIQNQKNLIENDIQDTYQYAAKTIEEIKSTEQIEEISSLKTTLDQSMEHIANQVKAYQEIERAEYIKDAYTEKLISGYQKHEVEAITSELNNNLLQVKSDEAIKDMRREVIEMEIQRQTLLEKRDEISTVPEVLQTPEMKNDLTSLQSEIKEHSQNIEGYNQLISRLDRNVLLRDPVIDENIRLEITERVEKANNPAYKELLAQAEAERVENEKIVAEAKKLEAQKEAETKQIVNIPESAKIQADIDRHVKPEVEPIKSIEAEVEPVKSIEAENESISLRDEILNRVNEPMPIEPEIDMSAYDESIKSRFVKPDNEKEKEANDEIER